MNNQQLGKVVIFVAIFVALIGILIFFFGDKLKWIGNLPGDIRFEKDNFKLYFPITTMILFSVLISLILKLINKF